MEKIKILTFYRAYLPGYKSGGPIRSIANMASNLKSISEFYIVTKNKDIGDEKPYENIASDIWTKRDCEFAYYSSKNKTTLSELRKIIIGNKFDLVILNGVFSGYTISYLILRKFNLIEKNPVVIMPRGELLNGAISLKSLKKKLFLLSSKIFRLYDDLIWHTTSTDEIPCVKEYIKNYKNITYIPNLPDTVTISNKKQKKKNELDIIYISRIAKIKNLLYALSVLEKVTGKVTFEIYGPISDYEYWNECKEVILKLPCNITVKYNGSIPNEKVKETISRSDLFFLPTLGENYGHAIVEALSAGTPVLISDKTPWVNLKSKNVGWDFPLNEQIQFINTIEELIDMNNIQYTKLKQSIKEYTNEILNVDDMVNKYNSFYKDVLREARVIR